MYDIDGAYGNNLWHYYLNKDMDNLKVAFDILPDGKSTPFYYTKTSGNLIFDVTMVLKRKDRWVKDGHKTPQPEWSTFEVVV